jgi:hypothetical protein
MSKAPVRILAVALALAGSTLRAQSDPTLDREIAFIRSLARDLRFINLAQEESDRLLRERKNPSEAKKVAQLGIEISLFGAKALNNREQQRTFFKEALDRSKTLAEQGGEGSLDAAAVLADAAYEYGRFLVEDIEMARVQEPDKVKALEDEAAAIFQLGRDTCDRVINELAGPAANNEEIRLRRHLTWLRKGVLLRENARAVRKDRDYLADLSRRTLEDLVMDAGEETLLGMLGLFEMSQN